LKCHTPLTWFIAHLPDICLLSTIDYILMPTIPLQPVLEDDAVLLSPLQPHDFDTLYAAASDPAIWLQHPNKNRWQRGVFATYFDGAIQSGGAFKIIEKANGIVAGSTRFYDYSAADSSILIGYTFVAVNCWGRGINKRVKQLMLNYIFGYVDKVIFHIGAQNIRSQIAIGRLGAVKTGEVEVAYFGESPKHNFIYEITRQNWFLATNG
jgi:RimJ/RimL family protein N-acetyltransferase